MNDFIFNVLPAQGPTIPRWIPILGGIPINSPLVGAFIGIVVSVGIALYSIKRAGDSNRRHIDAVQQSSNDYINAVQQTSRTQIDAVQQSSQTQIDAIKNATEAQIMEARHWRDERRLFFKNLLMHEARESIKLLSEGPVNLIPVDAWNSVVNSGEIALFEGKAIDLSDTYFQVQNYNYEAKRVRDAIEEMRLHPTTTDKTHASMLKDSFDKKTKPATLNRLDDLEKWLTRLKVEPITINANVSDISMHLKGPDGNEK